MKKIALYCLLALALPMPVRAAEALPPVTFRQDALLIKTDKAERRFTVEIARTPAQQARGLMFRKTLSRTHGMLFLWPREQAVNMWMKDTLIPLDMLFVDTHGRIVYIARRVVPGSTNLITAGRDVRAVLELPGGTAERQGINPGDRVLYSAFKP